MADDRVVDLYALAANTITPLQQRVHAALTDEPAHPEAIALRAGMLKHSAGRGPGTSIDVRTVCNVLGWLAVKGLADRTPLGEWRRV